MLLVYNCIIHKYWDWGVYKRGEVIPVTHSFKFGGLILVGLLQIRGNFDLSMHVFVFSFFFSFCFGFLGFFPMESNWVWQWIRYWVLILFINMDDSWLYNQLLGWFKEADRLCWYLWKLRMLALGIEFLEVIFSPLLFWSKNNLWIDFSFSFFDRQSVNWFCKWY